MPKSTDNDAVKQEVFNQVHEQLRNLCRRSSKEKAEQKERRRHQIRLKIQYRGEKRQIYINRNLDGTVSLHLLEDELLKMFRQQLNMYYTQEDNDVIVAIRTQSDLDRAVQLVDRQKQRVLRLILSSHTGGVSSSFNNPFSPDESGTYSLRVVDYKDSAPRSLPQCSPDSASSSGVSMSPYEQPSIPINWKQGRLLGRGAFGAVHIAYDVDQSRDVVVKRIDLPQHEDARKDVAGLETDVARLGTLHHPRLVQYLGVAIKGGVALIFMEYMAGGSVKDLINQYGPMSEKVTEKYTKQILQGLQFLHGEDIVHRDIKSANILRDLNGNVKIGDFGSAKKLQQLAAQLGSVAGTTHYMAPEVVNGESFGVKADVWAVGVTLVEMATGKVPYKDLAEMEVPWKIALEEPRSELPQTKSQVLKDLARRLMTKDPERRPTAVEALFGTPWTVPD